MAIGELILTGDTLNVGRIKINNFYSGNTILWSGSVGSNSIIRNNVDENLGNSATGPNTMAAGNNNSAGAPYAIAFWGSGNSSSNWWSGIFAGENNSIGGAHSFIGGGSGNIIPSSAYGNASVIAGGNTNSANTGNGIFIGGGISNRVSSNRGSIVGGQYNVVTGNFSTIAGGHSNTASGLYSSVGGGQFNQASGNHSNITGGQFNTATSIYSAVIGGFKTSISGVSHFSFIGGGQQNTSNALNTGIVGGFNNSTRGAGSFVGGGNNNIASGIRSTVIGGQTNTVSNSYSGIFAGRNNAATSPHSVVLGGFYNTVGGSQSATIGGRGNGAIHANCVVMGGGGRTSGPYQLVIGGVGTLTSSLVNNRFRVDARDSFANGACYANGGFFAFGADYGEFFEWFDGNPNNEDRTGYFVSLIDGKIEIGNSNIVGIISNNPSAVGDSADFYWTDMYLKDDFGNMLKEEYTKHEWIEYMIEKVAFTNSVGNKFKEYPNPSNKNGVPFTGNISTSATTSTISVPKINIDYDQASTYVPRSKRKEWSVVGLLGKLYVRTAELITANCIDVNSDGMAINGTTYKILENKRPHTENQYGIVRVFFK